MVAEYFKKKNLSDEVVAEHLTGLLDQLLRALEAKDAQKIAELAEPTFAKKLTENLVGMSSLKYSPPTGTGKSFVVDKMFVKGVNIDRSKNDTNFDYYFVQSMEKFGLRTFVHRFNTGDFYYYYMRDMKESHFSKLMDEKFQREDADRHYHFQRKTMNDVKAYKSQMFNKEFQLILRVVL